MRDSNSISEGGGGELKNNNLSLKEVSNMCGVLYLLENSIATMTESDVNEKDMMAA